MARRRQARATGSTIIVIDDCEELLASTARLLKRDGHQVLTANGGPQGVELVRATSPVDLVLVDYFMPGMTGEQVIQAIRVFDPLVQVVLQTGYASERPPREMLRRLDIQGYHDKSEGPEKLALWVEVGLKAAARVKALQQSRLGLRYILEATPQLHKIQPLEDLLQGVLTQTAGLLGAVDSFVAIASTARDGFVALHGDGDLRICAGTGRFSPGEPVVACLDETKRNAVTESLRRGEIPRLAGTTIVPLSVGETRVGVIYLDRPVVLERDAELLTIFANQAAVAIHNTTLYEFAAIDALTRVFTRRFFTQALLRELRVASRGGQHTALLMVDLDDLKLWNDRGGHLAGDRALEAVGRLLKAATRTTDIVGRWGGDEFAIVLPGADAAAACVVANRILAMSLELSQPIDGTPRPIGLSLGVGVLTPDPVGPQRRTPEQFEQIVEKLVGAADAALYQAKRGQKGMLGGVSTIGWTSTPSHSRRASVAAPCD